MNILKKLQWRYATKKFDTHKKISDKKLDLLKQAFNLTATSYGLQPLKLVIVKNQKIKEQLLPFAFGQKQIVEASYLLIICIEKTFGKKQIENYFERVKKIRNTSDEILNPFKKQVLEEFETLSFEEIQNASTKQAYIALGNLLNVCAVEQIDSCPMEGFIPEKFDAILDLQKHNLKSVLLLPIGYRSKEDFMAKEKKVRKPLKDSYLCID